MTQYETGRCSIQVAKTLRGFRADDAKIAQYFSATLLAGRLGLFAAALRSQGKMTPDRFKSLAAHQAIGAFDRPRVAHFLQAAGLLEIDELQGKVVGYRSMVLAYDRILAATARFVEESDPTPEERAVVALLARTDQLPLKKSDALQHLAKEFNPKTAQVACQLAIGYKIVKEAKFRAPSEPLVYSPSIWGRIISRIGNFLVSLNPTKREILLYLVGRVQSHQGMPEQFIRNEAKQQGIEDLLDMAIDVGILNRTEIMTRDGQITAFLSSPHYYASLEDEFGKDTCDRVKLFLDSIRNGQYFGRPETGRIYNPPRLLEVLLNNGQVGPCTAIGKDYVLVEKEGIIRARPASAGSSQHMMDLVQRDTVKKVYEFLTVSSTIEGSQIYGPSLFSDESSFRSEEEVRALAGELPQPMAEVEQDIIRRIREGR